MTPERDTPALELAKTLMVDKEVNPRVFNRVWMRRVAAALIETSARLEQSRINVGNWKSRAEDTEARLERARVVLQESATRIDILLLRGDLGADEKDEQTTKRWLSRVRKALADIPAAPKGENE